MPFAKVHSAQATLLSANIIDIEVDLSKGLNAFTLVGLPDKAVEESKDRVSAAIKHSGFPSPKSTKHKIVIALAPADIKKEGPAFDLGIAISYLIASEQLKTDIDINKTLFLGELSLDGKLRPIHGTLPIVLEARKRGFREIFLPKENAEEGALVDDIEIFGAKDLEEVVRHIKRKSSESDILKINKQPKTEIPRNTKSEGGIDFEDVRGQEHVKRGLEIAAAGGHNVALYGPPGTGKTMLSKAFVNILPDLSFEEILEVTAIHSVAGTLKSSLVVNPPLRSPHHTASYVAIIGGGATPKPGEITLAHRGVLFLDEFPEFERRVIDSLRQPLEDRIVSVTRAKGSAHFPSNFILLAAMNPCPCGNYGFRGKECVCNSTELLRYKKKISGPILERIDLWLDVPRIEHEKLSGLPVGEKSEQVKERVSRAREVQRERLRKHKSSATFNGEMNVRDLAYIIEMSEEAKEILNTSAKSLGLSPRVYHKIIKVAQTIADLSQSEIILAGHILEALQYRPKEQI